MNENWTMTALENNWFRVSNNGVGMCHHMGEEAAIRCINAKNARAAKYAALRLDSQREAA